jgi:CheY-like chemotaxis protein
MLRLGIMRLKVVIFDDDKDVLDLLTALVTDRGHEALSYSEPTLCPLYLNLSCTCTSGEACGDILITDNHMPQMSGLEFIQEQSLRGCKGINRNKAILSGAWSPEELQLANSLGCKIFYKPFDIKEFIEWIEECEANISGERTMDGTYGR